MKRIIILLTAAICVSLVSMAQIYGDSIYIGSSVEDSIICDFNQIKEEAQSAISPVKRQKVLQKISICDFTAKEKEELKALIGNTSKERIKNVETTGNITTLADIAFYTFKGDKIKISFKATTFLLKEKSLKSSGTYKIIDNKIYLTFTEGEKSGETQTLKGNGANSVIYNEITLKRSKRRD